MCSCHRAAPWGPSLTRGCCLGPRTVHLPSAPCHLTEEPGSLGPLQSPLCWPDPGPGDSPPGIAGCPGEAAVVLSRVTAVSFGDAAGVSPQVESRVPCPTQRSGLPAPAQRPFAHTERGCPLGLFPPPPGAAPAWVEAWSVQKMLGTRWPPPHEAPALADSWRPRQPCLYRGDGGEGGGLAQGPSPATRVQPRAWQGGC